MYKRLKKIERKKYYKKKNEENSVKLKKYDKNLQLSKKEFDPIKSKKLQYFFTYCKIVGKMIIVKSATGM